MIYVMSDLHGQYDMFIRMLELIKFNTNDTMYILGDIVDRGPKSIEIYRYIKERDNIILLKGNHEDMMYNALIPYGRSGKSLWYSNGGTATAAQMREMTPQDKQEMIEYLGQLPYAEVVEVNNIKYVLCHAGLVDYKDVETIDEAIKTNIQDDMILWLRPCSDEFEDCVIIHGHTPTGYLAFRIDEQKTTGYLQDELYTAPCPEFTIFKSESGKEINIDCGAAIPEKLGCLRLDDMKEFYIEANEEEKKYGREN